MNNKLIHLALSALALTCLSGPALAETPGVPPSGFPPPPPGGPAAVLHPLDPLTAPEMNTLVAVLKGSGKVGPTAMFPIVTLHEPPKAEARAYKSGSPMRREAFAVILDREGNHTYEAVVDVQARTILSFKEMKGVQPGVLVDEFESPIAWVKADKGWQEALRRRGITDFENVQVDTWAAGLLSEEDRKSGLRLIRCLSFYRPKGYKNPFYRPIEGLIVLVDVTNKKVRRIEDNGANVPLRPPGEGELGAAAVEKQLGKLRPVVNRIQCHQPSGGSFELNGHEVRWENWVFHYSLHPREGLVVHDVQYQDGNRLRPVLYRGALSEMVVPYGDPAKNWSFRNAFDLGEYGVGRLANTLRPGVEIPDYAQMLDATFADDYGKPFVIPKCVALYERDNGILWKHRDFDTKSDESRRARWLHLTYVATVGNYDYALCWIFGQDGSIQVEAQLTGIVLAKGTPITKSVSLDATGEEKYGRLVGPNIVAPNHQHFFNFRLDLDVDGARNSVVETNNVAAPAGPDNPDFNAFSRHVTPIKSEKNSGRDLDMQTSRSWMVINPDVKNGLGQNTGYMLVPEENAMPYLHPQSPVRKRAGFIDHHVWFTQFKPNEMNAAGFYPNQSTVTTGLPGWCNDDESLDGQDVVMWYTFGVTHNPRPEEWPVMPSHRTGFQLLPNGFFSRNPALDVRSTVPDPKP